MANKSKVERANLPVASRTTWLTLYTGLHHSRHVQRHDLGAAGAAIVWL
jgi:hypothetical protein